MGHGVSTCATCDGFFYRGKKIAVVGGGDSAMEEANFLTKFATEVNLLHRSETFRASKIMVDRARSNPKIKFHTNTTVDEVVGSPETGVTGLKLRDTKTSKTSAMDLDGIFIAIGHNPNTDIFKVRSTWTSVVTSRPRPTRPEPISRRFCLRRCPGSRFPPGGHRSRVGLHVCA
jgi:thioredoxin reductase (NADPH)